MHLTTSTLLTLASAALLAAPPEAQEAAQDPYTKPDDSWISLSGTVDNVRADAFTLDYGDGMVTVEMDDGDRDADGYKLMKGDKVTVYGLVDDDLFETTTIEASSVYVENIGTYFYASSVDEEDVFVTVTMPIVVAQTWLQGKVTSVAPAEKEFTLDTGKRQITVEVDSMTYDPLDDEGYQKIEKGHRVSVSGDMDIDFFEGRVFEADSVVTLAKKQKMGKQD